MDRVKELFLSHNFRATAQRIIVYKALEELGHATVEKIFASVHNRMPTITMATTYKVLESMAECGLIGKLFTSSNRLQYDITPTQHHHIMDSQQGSGQIVDYHDPELSELILKHLQERRIEGFELSDIRLQIIGTFK